MSTRIGGSAAMWWMMAATAAGAEPTADAAAPPAFNSADIAWMLVATAFVLMMTAPGLALFYGGLVRKKNVLGMMMQCLFLMGMMSVVWAAYGYSLCFGGDLGGAGFIGDFRHLGMQGVASMWDGTAQMIPAQPGTGIPKLLHFAFQMMFFIITPALICGAFAERMKFSSMVLFSLLWGTFVYCPVAHWVWSEFGWCSEINPQAAFRAFDFAGGTVIHVTSGFSALACSMLLGPRLGFRQEPMPPHNLTYTATGAALLWVGWFGFNAGSAGAANFLAVNALVVTHLAAAAGCVAWAVAEWITRDKPSVLGGCSGAVAGLVCITPASGSVTPQGAVLMGAAAGVVCYWACTSLKNRFHYDDTLDAFGVHGVGGTLGGLLTGALATRAITGKPEPAGLIDGNSHQLIAQAVSIGAAMLWAVLVTVIILKMVDALLGLRVSQAGELQGLDISQHGEEGYIFH